MKRVNRVGICISLMLIFWSSCSAWVGIHIWTKGKVTLQEPIFPVLVTETIAWGLTALFGLACLIYFWRTKWVKL